MRRGVCLCGTIVKHFGVPRDRIIDRLASSTHQVLVCTRDFLQSYTSPNRICLKKIMIKKNKRQVRIIRAALIELILSEQFSLLPSYYIEMACI